MARRAAIGSAARVRSVPDFMRCLDVGLVTSHTEACSLTIIEMMASKLPVVATHVGGNSELLSDGEDGRLAPAARPAAMAEAVLSLLDNESLRRNIGRRAAESRKAVFGRTHDAGLSTALSTYPGF